MESCTLCEYCKKGCKKDIEDGGGGFLEPEGLATHVIVREKGHYFGTCIAFDPPDMAPVGMDNKVTFALNLKPKDELYIFVYDKDQIYIPSVSRIYGSDFRKISDVSIKYPLLLNHAH